jgi:hypothetical protein
MVRTWDGRVDFMTDNLATDRLAGTLAAQSFLIEGLYAAALMRTDEPLRSCHLMSSEMMRRFEMIGGTMKPSSDHAWRIMQLGLHHLEQFWRALEARVAIEIAENPKL